MPVRDEATKSSVFLKACRKEKAPHTPVWLMRQAGRYMKEYREIREKVRFLELVKTPDLACRVTVAAVEKLRTDAAIIFADILVITEPMGFELEFPEKSGPVIHNPFASSKDLARLEEFDPRESLSFVMEAISLTRKALKPDIPLIGFAGAPFTVASYVIEGASSRDFQRTKTLMRSDPGLWKALLERISQATTNYLLAQIEAGAEAIQLFDTWIGTLNPREYKEYALPYTRQVLEALPKDVPRIYFGTGTEAFLEEFALAGASVIGVDFRSPLDKAWSRLGDAAIQGNLDPTALLSDRDVIRREATYVLNEARGRRGHIFNLGHGVLPQTPFENVRYLVDFVHEATAA
ncbi:MAG: uroporphyrinogen decarboxylase [Pseudomonadota bacterium]